jgi:hypothetical protein
VISFDRLTGERAKPVDGEVFQRDADDKAIRKESCACEMKKARKQLALREIAGRAEQDDNLRQFRPNPCRYFRHSATPSLSALGSQQD